MSQSKASFFRITNPELGVIVVNYAVGGEVIRFEITKDQARCAAHDLLPIVLKETK